MRTPTRLALYVAALLAVGAAAAGVGALVSPSTSTAKSAGHDMSAATMAADPSAASGLAVSSDGYSLTVDRTTLSPGRPAQLRIRVLDASGHALRRFDEEAPGVRMHFIVVRRDLTGYQHVHPRLANDGTFMQRLTLPQAGAYRAFADFELDGVKHVLGIDLLGSGGQFSAKKLPPVATVAQADGYRVQLLGTARAASEAELSFRITHHGAPARLDPYLGARGHLVALRVGDLAYSHVHPLAGDRQSGEVRFASEFHTAGPYRLFLQFNSGGAVHTVPFTFEVTQ